VACSRPLWTWRDLTRRRRAFFNLLTMRWHGAHGMPGTRFF
jgi:hypothetical protein